MNEITSEHRTLDEVFGARTVSDKTDGKATAMSRHGYASLGKDPAKVEVVTRLLDSLADTLGPIGLTIAAATFLWDPIRDANTVSAALVEARLIPEVKVSVSKQVDDLLSQGNLVI